MDGCHFNNDCSQQTACLNQTCQDPCRPNGDNFFDECGVNAECQVISHAPTCKCPEGFRPLNSPYVACVPLDMDLEEITCLKVWGISLFIEYIWYFFFLIIDVYR